MADSSTRASAPSIARLEDLHRHYHMGDTTVRALDGVSLDFRQGDYIAIMGRSGSGKSTLLNILGCLDRATAGSYFLGDHEVSQLSDNELSEVRGERIGFVFQSFNLIPQLSVLENLEVPLFYQGRVGQESRAKAQELADRVGLGDRLHHRPTELSGGQQQRVAIARALVNAPRILLADEPTGALDSSTSAEIMDLFSELNKSGITVIVVTHDPEVAARAWRRLSFHDGALLKAAA